jgi:excinuclease ABC subunit C
MQNGVMSDDVPVKAKPKTRTTSFDAGAAVLREQLRTINAQPGVYRMMTADGAVLYVGKAKNLKKRVTSYTQRARLPLRLQRMVAQIASVEVTVTETETEALLLEANFIRRLKPPYNLLLRDDKSYPYILIRRDHDFPQLMKHRGARNAKGWYFGPFASGYAVTETLTLMQRGFMLRNCSDSFFAARHRPCLQYHIKRCTAPCVGKVSVDEYAKQVDEAREFLQGKSQDIQQKFATEMQVASDALDFERAAALRDRIKILTGIQSKQDINIAGIGDADIVALHQDAGRTAIQIFFFRADRNYGARVLFPAHGEGLTPPEILSSFLSQFYADKPAPPALILSAMPDDALLIQEALTERAGHKVSIIVPKLGDKKRLIDHAQKNAKEALARHMADSEQQAGLLNRVAEIFGLPDAPRRIEVYDNSHISGSYPIGAMIAAGADGFLKKTYRKFDIKTEIAAGDDYAMMGEVLTRRFKRLIDEDPARQSGMWPDLVLIDGGQGQLNAVLSVMEELGLPDITVVGVAKGPDRNAGRERFFMPGREPFSLPPEDPALYYLQRLRDEAHRFAIGTHRAKRVKAIGVNGLEDIPGIGATRKRALLHHFGSAKAVAGAGVEDLSRVEGISRDIAQRIYDYFRG